MNSQEIQSIKLHQFFSHPTCDFCGDKLGSNRFPVADEKFEEKLICEDCFYDRQ